MRPTCSRVLSVPSGGPRVMGRRVCLLIVVLRCRRLALLAVGFLPTHIRLNTLQAAVAVHPSAPVKGLHGVGRRVARTLHETTICQHILLISFPCHDLCINSMLVKPTFSSQSERSPAMCYQRRFLHESRLFRRPGFI
jgi:hypothetical protein